MSINKPIICLALGAQSYFFSNFFQTFEDFSTKRKLLFSHNLWLISKQKTVLFGRYKWNVLGYGNNNQAYTEWYSQLHTQNCFVHPNGLTISTEIINLHLWNDNSSNETGNQTLKNKTATFNFQPSIAAVCNALKVQVLFFLI